MLARAKAPEQGGARIAIIMNGSPLFTGDAGSGESEIRRFILENDLLETLVALPEQLFYNTGIATYVWLLTNRKAPARRGLVQLIDATAFWSPMRRSLGDKRREIPPDKAADVLKLLENCQDGEKRQIAGTTYALPFATSVRPRSPATESSSTAKRQRSSPSGDRTSTTAFARASMRCSMVREFECESTSDSETPSSRRRSMLTISRCLMSRVPESGFTHAKPSWPRSFTQWSCSTRGTGATRTSTTFTHLCGTSPSRASISYVR